MPGVWDQILQREFARLRPDSVSIPRLFRSPFARARDRMSKHKSLFKALTETGPLIALGTALAILVLIAGPASAQFFNFPGVGGQPQRSAPPRSGGGWFGGDFFAPFQQQQQQAPRQDFSRAPAPAKRETIPNRGSVSSSSVGMPNSSRIAFLHACLPSRASAL